MNATTELARPASPASVSARRRPIRVAFVLHEMQVAGAEMLVKETVERLNEAIEPTIVCLDRLGQLGREMAGHGTTVIEMQRRPGRDWRLIGRMARAFEARRIEVIHAHQYTPFFYAALAKLLTRPRPRLIFTEHGRHYPDIVGRTRRLGNRLLLARVADDVNAVCQFSAEALSRADGFSARPVSVIENGIELQRYGGQRDRAAARKNVGLAPDRRYIVNVARFHPVKDQRTLVAAFALVAATHPDLDLLLVGDGPERSAIEAQVASLGVSSRVIFTGIRSDVPAMLAAADVFCLSSVSEAASLTLLEAMASRLPVVVSNVGGNPEIVRDGVDGILAPRGDAQAFAAAFTRLLDDDVLGPRMGAAGAERVREHYQLDRTIARYGDLYQRLAGAA